LRCKNLKAEVRLLERRFTELSKVWAHDAGMQQLFDLICANPWPFVPGLIVVVGAILAEGFATQIRSTGIPDARDD